MDISRFTDDHCREQLFPLTLTRHTAAIRIGIMTIQDKWDLALTMFPKLKLPGRIPADIIPGHAFFDTLNNKGWEETIADAGLYKVLKHPWDITQYNDWSLRQDFEMLVKGRQTAIISDTVNLIGTDSLFVEEGAKAEHCYINTTTGPVYISSGVEIMEGAMLRGPLYLGQNTVVKMGATIYGATSIGPHCIVGGEIKNSVIFGYSNKAHEGYLGDSVIGEWCNLGAGTTCSNIRNTATPVKVWNMKNKSFTTAGLKCGVLMGDYSRAAINSAFNTGTVVGVSANIFQGGGLLPKYIPSFAWGPVPDIKYTFDKAVADINNWMNFKNRSLSIEQINTLQHIFSHNE